MEELFKEHPELKGYMVGTRGTIMTPKGMAIKGSLASNGYRVIHTYKPKQTRHYVHKLMVEAHKGMSDTERVRIINGNKADLRIENLEWATDAGVATPPAEKVILDRLDELDKTIRVLDTRIKHCNGNSFEGFYKQQKKSALASWQLNKAILSTITKNGQITTA
jgi:hypothetical protein